MSNDSIWTHAHSITSQDPGWTLTRFGSSVIITPSPAADSAGVQNWVHFPVPTQIVIGSKRVQAVAAHLRFGVGAQATILAINIWDGDRRIAVIDNLNIGTNPTKTYTWNISNSEEINYGVEISVAIRFKTVDPSVASVGFVGAGIDFAVVG